VGIFNAKAQRRKEKPSRNSAPSPHRAAQRGRCAPLRLCVKNAHFSFTLAAPTQSSTGLHFEPVRVQPLSEQFPEFVTLPDSLELWLRRLPRLAEHLSQLSHGEFWYDHPSGQVQLVPQRASDLSLQEAWEIEDAFSGYASRTYPAVRATAQALSIRDNS
jgi:hypothetical protein